jgi:hypothetical protein
LRLCPSRRVYDANEIDGTMRSGWGSMWGFKCNRGAYGQTLPARL